jgi:hypothetical protein
VPEVGDTAYPTLAEIARREAIHLIFPLIDGHPALVKGRQHLRRTPGWRSCHLRSLVATQVATYEF